MKIYDLIILFNTVNIHSSKVKKITYKDYIEISTYFFMEVINWKENKEVGTICFEVRIPMKKTKIFLEFLYISFRKKICIFGFNNFILEENKNMYGNAFIPLKSHWNIGLMKHANNALNISLFTRVVGKLEFLYKPTVVIDISWENVCLWISRTY